MTIGVAFTYLKIVVDRRASLRAEIMRMEFTVTFDKFNSKMKRACNQFSTTLNVGSKIIGTFKVDVGVRISAENYSLFLNKAFLKRFLSGRSHNQKSLN